MLSVKLKNHQNIMYTGEIQVGSPPKSQNVVFDTGSGWLTVATTYCQLCDPVAKNYNPLLSTSATLLNTDKKYLGYGSVTLGGFIHTDKVCLGSLASGPDSMCIDPF